MAPEHGERGGRFGLGGGSEGGSEGGGEGGGGEGAFSLTTTVTPYAIETSGLAVTEAPSIADKLANGSLAWASTLATRADGSVVFTIWSCKFTLAAVMARLAKQSGG